MRDPRFDELNQLKRELWELNRALDQGLPFNLFEWVIRKVLFWLEHQVERLVEMALKRLPHRW